MKVLITGVAGFIGSMVAIALLKRGDTVVGIDNLNDYYDVTLKESRLELISSFDSLSRFIFVKDDIANKSAVDAVFSEENPDRVINLAAQAGVRYSLDNPLAYVESNITGFANLLEACRDHNVEHLVYASSSSVYGANESLPYSVHDNVDHPLSLYAASKKSNELMAHCYSHLYGIPTTGLRFFTVYGPWSRPDMAMFKFTRAILSGEPIDVFNYGKHRRDFTYIDDIVEGVIKVLDNPAEPNKEWSGKNPDPATSNAPWRIYNIGNQKSIELMDYIHALENALGKKAEMNLLPLQPGDVLATWANVSELSRDIQYQPTTTVEYGVSKFVEWYKGYYKI